MTYMQRRREQATTGAMGEGDNLVGGWAAWMKEHDHRMLLVDIDSGKGSEREWRRLEKARRKQAKKKKKKRMMRRRRK